MKNSFIPSVDSIDGGIEIEASQSRHETYRWPSPDAK
jgi:hypothetical protein